MEAIQTYWSLFGIETYIFAGALAALVLLFVIRGIEHMRGKNLFAGAQDAADRGLHRLAAHIMYGADHALSHLKTLPKALGAGLVHSLALIALSVVRMLERLLKRVIDAVRGKRELTLGGPPSSSFFTDILPHRRRPHFETPDGSQGGDSA